MNRSILTALLGAALVALAFAGAWADVPRNVNVQGQLLDDVGDPAPGAYFFTFKIYDDPVAGTEIWPLVPNEEQQAVTVDANGLWNVMVGASLGLTETVFLDTNRWLEVTVNDDDGVNDPEVLPRLKLSTNPFAYRSATSQTADLANEAAHAAAADLADQASQAAIANDAMSLGGIPASSYTLVGHVHSPSGIVPQGSGSTLDADLLDGREGAFYQDADNIVAGTLAPDRFSAYTDLGAEGRLDDNDPADLLTRLQADNRFNSRYVQTVGDAMTGNLDFNAPGLRARVEASLGQYKTYSNTGLLEGLYGSDGTAGRLELLDDGAMRARLFGSSYGELNLFDVDGTHTVSLDADVVANNGACLYLYQPDGSNGIYLGAGNGVANAARLYMYNSGGSNTIRFDADAVGSAAAFLPGDAIQDFEILDEPGVVQNVGTVGYTLTGTGIDTILWRDIDCPASGFALVMASAELYIQHVNGTTSRLNFGVGNFPTAYSPDQDKDWVVPSAAPSAVYNYGAAAQKLFSVSAGSNRLYLMVEKELGNTQIVYDATLSVVYFPTSYGTVSALAGAGDVGEFAEAELQLATELTGDAEEVAETIYKVDLRELEVRAARAEAEAERAQRELLEARVAAERTASANASSGVGEER